MPQLVLLPGLGADSRLFHRQSRFFGENCLTPDLPTPGSMQVSAREFAREVWSKIESDVSEAYVLGGISFGGQIALEVARIATRKPRAVVLISSLRYKEGTPALFKLNAALSKMIPNKIMPSWLSLMAIPFAMKEGLSKDDRTLLRQMAREVDLDLLRWGTQFCLDWNWTERDFADLNVEVKQIHGDWDWIIPLSDPQFAETIPRAKHLLPCTHPKELNSFLEQSVFAAS